jgi:hypothetical protein
MIWLLVILIFLGVLVMALGICSKASWPGILKR